MPDAYLQESRRLRPHSQEEFHILRTTPVKDYSDILFLATQLCGTSAAGLFVLENDEHWVKAVEGIREDWILSRPWLINTTVEKKGIHQLHVPNGNSAFGSYTFYAGIPLYTPTGEELAVLFVLGENEELLDIRQQQGLRLLGDQVLRLLAFCTHKNQFLRVQMSLEQKYKDLEKFASVVSHDIKSPLANIISLIELIKDENEGNLNPDTLHYLNFLDESSQSLRHYVDGLLKFYRSEKTLETREEDVKMGAFFREITGLYSIDPDIHITYPQEGTLDKVNRAALTQIFLNLISNALKYNHKVDRNVHIIYAPTRDFHVFEVQDNGNGISPEDKENIFELFYTLDQTDRYGHVGSGIGLATVKKLVTLMGGDISVRSETDLGSTFVFSIKK